MQRPDLWQPAIEELCIMEDRKVWCLVPETEVPAGKKAIGCCWVFANKYNAKRQIV